MDRPAFGGGVIAEAPDGRVLFLRGAAPGDRVDVELTEVKRRFARARIVRLVPGDRRADVFCAHATTCGGCPWMVIPLADQRAALEAHVRRETSRIGDSPPAIEPIVATAPEQAWRSTARMHWQDGTLGYRAAGGHSVIDIETCPVLRAPLPAIVDAVRAVLAPRLGGEGTLRLTADPGAISGTVDVRPVSRSPQGLRKAVRRLVDGPSPVHGAILAVGRQIEGFGRPHNVMDGVLHPAEAFVQAHRTGNRALTEAVLHAVAEGGPGPVLELFAGSGNFTFALAGAGRSVTAIEIDPSAARALEQAARAQGLGDRVRAITGDAGRLPRQIAQGPDAPVIAVLDPPRIGARAAVDGLAGLGPRLRRIVYVSCNPATLARDARRLLGRGWRMRSARPFDLFPHTGHVEVLAVFEPIG